MNFNTIVVSSIIRNPLHMINALIVGGNKRQQASCDEVAGSKEKTGEGWNRCIRA